MSRYVGGAGSRQCFAEREKKEIRLSVVLCGKRKKTMSKVPSECSDDKIGNADQQGGGEGIDYSEEGEEEEEEVWSVKPKKQIPIRYTYTAGEGNCGLVGSCGDGVSYFNGEESPGKSRTLIPSLFLSPPTVYRG
ncbi:hypothetical protein RHMOL_Rhmol13G0226700 [Rhododendron molle]|uniref:Uncharacterized protein n=1 Tax=Rhododendron molle TaxID=49168 RepID=A0ACC0LA15_RHOML|nr:hypothetical protein RHMOL_Rhmol13G0226700 [Rhododendron molle]